ncbi:GAF domain-containing protein [Pseudonocardia humida]|uniref:GAF domain-containing protein n=1 Tax=Pseudonocardia humida TaxID=2800819 RepID=A0ABT0ZVB7_9PSEU|nr:GAF domain-containing protein [Pseudonocardia humida]MCO1654614.1 GAF domain-containing protein [Pseudonocardia humida]
MPIDDVAFSVSLMALLARVDLPTRADGQDVQARLDEVLSAATGVLGVDSVGLMMLDEDDVLRVVGVTDDAAGVLEAAQQRLDVGPGIDCVRDGAVVAVDDLAGSERYAPVWECLRGPSNGQPRGGGAARAVLSVPVRVRGETVGTLNALHRTPQRWDDAQVRAVEAYGAVIAILLRLEAAARTDGSVPNRPRPIEED